MNSDSEGQVSVGVTFLSWERIEFDSETALWAWVLENNDVRKIFTKDGIYYVGHDPDEGEACYLFALEDVKVAEIEKGS